MTTKIREESYCDFCGKDKKIEGTLDLSNTDRHWLCGESIRLELCYDCFYKFMKTLKQKMDEAEEMHE